MLTFQERPAYCHVCPGSLRTAKPDDLDAKKQPERGDACHTPSFVLLSVNVDTVIPKAHVAS